VTDGNSESSASWAPQVHQATGMIVAQAGVDTAEALRRLLDRAKATRRTVEETAVDVLEGRLRFDGS
jgi:hypothetical protein